jgi:hypothetical protein
MAGTVEYQGFPALSIASKTIDQAVQTSSQPSNHQTILRYPFHISKFVNLHIYT